MYFGVGKIYSAMQFFKEVYVTYIVALLSHNFEHGFAYYFWSALCVKKWLLRRSFCSFDNSLRLIEKRLSTAANSVFINNLLIIVE